MYISDFNDIQRKDFDLFHLILEAHGWYDTDDTEKRLFAGESLCPEGKLSFAHQHTRLEVQFHAPINMITLQIRDVIDHEQIRFYFFYDNHIERILEWIADVSQRINMESYIDCLKEVFGKCEMILLELAQDEIYEVKPPASVVSELN